MNNKKENLLEVAKIKRICDLARNPSKENEKELTEIINSGVPIDLYNGESPPAVAILAQEKNFTAALYLVNKFNANMGWFAFGLGTKGYIDEAKNYLATMPNQSSNTLSELLNFRNYLVLGLGKSGYLNEAEDLINIVKSEQFWYPIQEVETYFVRGLGQACNIDAATKIIEKNNLIDYRQAYMQGLIEGGHFSEANKQLNLWQSLKAKELETIYNSIYIGLKKSNYLSADPNEILELLANFNNENLKRYINNELIYLKKTNDWFVDRATKIRKIKNEYHLDFNDAKILSEQGEGARRLFLQERIFVRKEYADGSKVENDLPRLPIDIMRLIFKFVVGSSEQNVERIFSAVNKKLFVTSSENNLSHFKSGLFSYDQYKEKNDLDNMKYLRRIKL